MKKYSLEDEKAIISEILEDKELTQEEKKPLRDILSNQLSENPLSEEYIKKLKNKFLKIKDEMQDCENSYDALMEIQEKLASSYNRITKD